MDYGHESKMHLTIKLTLSNIEGDGHTMSTVKPNSSSKIQFTEKKEGGKDLHQLKILQRMP